MKITEALLDTLTADAVVRDMRSNPSRIAVWSRYCGLASTLAAAEHGQDGITVGDPERFIGRSARELAALARSERLVEASVGMAALNSLLEVDESRCRELNAHDLLFERGAGKTVVLVGHFPFVPELREIAGHLSVLELRPQAGDLPADEAQRVIPEAEVVAITGTAFLNHTMEQLLGYCRPEALVIVLGPTTPLSPVLFDFGVDAVSGIRVVDPELVLAQVAAGAGFRQIRGVRLLTMERRG